MSRRSEVHFVEPIAPGTVGLCWVEVRYRDFVVEFTDDGQALGGPAKASNLPKFGQQLQRVAAAADEAGATPIFMYDQGTPQSAIDLAERWFGPGGAVPIP